MLQDEYDRLAKSVGYVSEQQAKRIINVALDKIKQDARAGIVEIWLMEHGMNADVLRSYLRIADRGIPEPQVIALHSSATGLLVWVAEKRKPIWINEIKRGATSGRNLLTDENIDGRYFNLFDRTRAFAAIPVEYRDQLCAIMTVEVIDDDNDRLEKSTIELLQEVAEPTAILIWKASVFVENERHADLAIDYLRKAANATATRRRALHRTGFIARPFKPEFEFISKRIESVFRASEVQATTYRPKQERPYVVEEMLEQINSAHFGVADITSLNQNVLIETGVMIGIEKPLIILREINDEAPLPFNIAGHQVFRYAQKGEDVVIFDATNTGVPLEKFISTFITGLIKKDEEFKIARPSYGG